MGDLAAQLAAKFNTSVPLDASPAEPDATSATPQKKRSADPRAQSDPNFAHLAGLVADVLGCEPTEVHRHSRLRADLGADSLSVIELTVRAEEEFGVRLNDRTVLGFHTLGDAADYFSKAQEKREDAE